jgi:hypothetical protein
MPVELVYPAMKQEAPTSISGGSSHIGVIYSIKELEFEEIEKEDGTIVDRIKSIKHVRFEAEYC